jgi:hypothetical protein
LRKIKAIEKLRKEKIALIEDMPTPDIALPIDREIELTNPLVKATYQKFGPFQWDKEIKPEHREARAL